MQLAGGRQAGRQAGRQPGRQAGRQACMSVRDGVKGAVSHSSGKRPLPSSFRPPRGDRSKKHAKVPLKGAPEMPHSTVCRSGYITPQLGGPLTSHFMADKYTESTGRQVDRWADRQAGDADFATMSAFSSVGSCQPTYCSRDKLESASATTARH
jgi:hypothetical protein